MGETVKKKLCLANLIGLFLKNTSVEVTKDLLGFPQPFQEGSSPEIAEEMQPPWEKMAGPDINR